jgi:hypothetical protein
MIYKIIILILILIFLFYFVNKEILNEYFMVSTWTPYYVDYYNQPGYTNYFYNNGYMYPLY